MTLELFQLLKDAAASGLLGTVLVIFGILYQTGRIVAIERKVNRCEKSREDARLVVSRLYYLTLYFAGRRDTGLPALTVLLGDEPFEGDVESRPHNLVPEPPPVVPRANKP